MKTKNENDNKVVNVENTKAVIEQAAELSDMERLRGYMANHAVEHYCAALDLDTTAVAAKLERARRDDSTFWVYTQPAIGGTRADGKPNPTQSEWETANPDAIRCDILDSKQWYKKAVTIEDALSVRRISASLTNYDKAAEKGKERKIAALKLECANYMIAGNFEKAQAVAAEIAELQK